MDGIITVFWLQLLLTNENQMTSLTYYTPVLTSIETITGSQKKRGSNQSIKM